MGHKALAPTRGGVPRVPPLCAQEGGAWSWFLSQNSQGAERPAREPGPKCQLAQPCSPDSESRPERVPTPLRSCSAPGNRGCSDAEGRGSAPDAQGVQGWGPAGPADAPPGSPGHCHVPCPVSSLLGRDPCVFNQPQSNASSVFMG